MPVAATIGREGGRRRKAKRQPERGNEKERGRAIIEKEHTVKRIEGIKEGQETERQRPRQSSGDRR